MDFSYSKEEEVFREEVRQFLRTGVTPEEREALKEWSFISVGPPEKMIPACREFLRKLGSKGWICPSWPKEYGGLGGTFLMDLIISEELAEQNMGLPNFTAATYCGPTILRFGSKEQKAEFLPMIAKGQAEFALCYTESEAGSDLASVRMTATESGENYILNGEKLYAHTAHYAEFHWVLARTDPTSAKHQGLSLFIVDAKTPGVSVSPLRTMANQRVNVVFYDDVKVPKKNLVGQRNCAWQYVMLALNYERINGMNGRDFIPYFKSLIEFVKTTSYGGDLLAKDPLVRQKIAQIAIEIEICCLLRQKAAWVASKGEIPYRESSVYKVFISESAQRFANSIMQVAGLRGQIEEDSSLVPAQIRMFLTVYLATVMLGFGGGGNELLRDVIALRGLGLPRK